LKKSVIKYELS